MITLLSAKTAFQGLPVTLIPFSDHLCKSQARTQMCFVIQKHADSLNLQTEPATSETRRWQRWKFNDLFRLSDAE